MTPLISGGYIIITWLKNIDYKYAQRPNRYIAMTPETAERIKDNSIFKINPEAQDKSKEIRYSKKNEFNEEIVKEYFEKVINLNNKKLDNSLLKEPFFLDN